MKISVAIMAMPARHKQAVALYKKLRKMPFEWVTIMEDEVAAGTHESEWNNGKASLLCGVGKGDWHVVIQDDAILTPNFYENIEGAIANCPGGRSLISLYTGKARPFPRRITEAVKRAERATWLRHYLLIWGVGIVIPTDHIKPMIDFVDDWDEPYDTRIGIFYSRNRLPVYYTMPSLVDHDDDLSTTIPGHGTKPGARVAHKLATGLINWNDKVVDI